MNLFVGEKNLYERFGKELLQRFLSVCGNFGAENAADFKDGTAGARNFAAVGAAALEMEQSGAVQVSGASGQMTMQKGLAIAQLREDLRAINRTARALAVDDSAVGELFRMPNGSSEQKLLAAARAFFDRRDTA